MTKTRTDPRELLLDAAERLLERAGSGAISTRNVAREAGVNHGLVHYHFGSVEGLLVAVCERSGRRQLDYQRAVWEADLPFAECWRAAMVLLAADAVSGRAAVSMELRALARTRPELRRRALALAEEWRALLTRAFSNAAQRHELSPRLVEPLATLVMSLLPGMAEQRLLGEERRQDELANWLTGMLVSVSEGPAAAGRA